MSKAQHSGKQGPLKATIPISGVVKHAQAGPPGSPLFHWPNKAGPHVSGQRSPGASCYKGRQQCGGAVLEAMRRTASLDTVYLKGHWPKDHWGPMGILQVEKATQTDDSDLSDAWQVHYVADSVAGAPRAKLRANNSSQTLASCMKPKSSMRSSVEGLNQEIERIVLRTGAQPNDRLAQATPEGHRAPLAEMLQSGRSRSVNTQTPQDFGNSSGSSSRGSSSPPWNRRSGSSFEGSSPDTDAKLGTSPQINRFLAREPPDGCEKVRLKSLDERADVLLDCAPQPSTFKLRPSLGSAFKSLQPCRRSPRPEQP